MISLHPGSFWYLDKKLHLVLAIYLEEMAVVTMTDTHSWYGSIDDFLSKFKPLQEV